jgi:hypothetical protein
MQIALEEQHLSTRSVTKVMTAILFSENVTAKTVKFSRMIHTSFSFVTLFFHEVSITLTQFCQS